MFCYKTYFQKFIHVKIYFLLNFSHILKFYNYAVKLKLILLRATNKKIKINYRKVSVENKKTRP